MCPSQSSVADSTPCSFNNGAACPDNDGNVCTRGSCQNGLCVPVPADGTPCLSDGDPCTEDECEDGVCRHPPVVEGGPCEPDGDDGNECTLDTCQDGECVPVPNDGGGCDDDGLECTLDVCVGTQCSHPPKPPGTPCSDDGLECTLDQCAGSSCVHPEKPDETPCTDDGNDCTDDYCLGGQCAHPDKEVCEACTLSGVAGAVGGFCESGGCEVAGCSVSLSSISAEPCNVVTMSAFGDCWPDCGSMGFDVEAEYPTTGPYASLPPWLELTLPGSVDCAGPGQTVEVGVTVLAHAPPGPVTIRFRGQAPNGEICEATGTVTVVREYPLRVRPKTCFVTPRSSSK